MAISVTPLKPGQMYHIWTHANGVDNLFETAENYHFFLKKYAFYITPIADTFAYCLMPNHLHLMVRIKNEDTLMEFFNNQIVDSKTHKLKSNNQPENAQSFKNLGGYWIKDNKCNKYSRMISQQFSNLFNSYTKSFNKYANRKGSLFIPNFKRKHIQSEKYFINLIVYIHTNPVHHGFSDRPEDWPYSSWRAYLLDKSTHIEKVEALSWLNGGLDDFISLHRTKRMKNDFIQFEG